MFYGPLTNQMAIVEVKLARKKLFRGTLNRFLGFGTMFPLVNSVTNTVSVNQEVGFVTIVSVEELAGQVVNLFSVIEEFDPEHFNIELSDLKFADHNVSLITKFKYDKSSFKNLKSDYVVRNQWGFVI